MPSNVFSPKRGKLDRPAICKPSPPPPILPILPETYYGSVIVSPYVGACDDFLLQARAWSTLAPHDAVVQVTAPAVDWATVERLNTRVINNLVPRIAFKLTEVEDGIHYLPVTFTWYPGQPREHTTTQLVKIEQICRPAVRLEILATYDPNPGSIDLEFYSFAWAHELPTTDRQNRRLSVPALAWSDYRTSQWNAPIPYVAGTIPDPPAGTYDATLDIWWRPNAPPADPDETHTVELTIPDEIGWVCIWTEQPDPGDPTELILHAACRNKTVGGSVSIPIEITVDAGNLTDERATISNLLGSFPVANWHNVPDEPTRFTIDAAFATGYNAQWRGYSS
jgi:hypothetical protein